MGTYVLFVPFLSICFMQNAWLVEHLRLEQSTWKATGIQFTINRLIHAPLNVLCFYLIFVLVSTMVCAFGSNSLSEWSIALLKVGPLISSKIHSSYLDTLVNNWRVWSLPQLFNYHIIPLQF